MPILRDIRSRNILESLEMPESPNGSRYRVALGAPDLVEILIESLKVRSRSIGITRASGL